MQFASGITPKSYTISLSRGIIDKLNDEELEACNSTRAYSHHES